jgi:ribosome-associated protein
MDLRKLQKTVVEALEDIKGRDIVVFEVDHVTSVFDRVVIATAESNRQTKALAHNVKEKVRAAGGHVYGTEGEDAGEWVLVDLGDIVVHIMLPTVRAQYNLEELWNLPKPRAPREKRPAAPAEAKPTAAKPVKAKVKVKAKTTAKKKASSKPKTQPKTKSKTKSKKPQRKVAKKAKDAKKSTRSVKGSVKSVKRTKAAKTAKKK